MLEGGRKETCQWFPFRFQTIAHLNKLESSFAEFALGNPHSIQLVITRQKIRTTTELKLGKIWRLGYIS